MTTTAARRNALALFVLALLVQLGLTAGWREEAGTLAEEQRRAMREQRDAARKLAELQRRSGILQRARLRIAAGPPLAVDAAIQAVRGGVVGRLGNVRNVRLDVHPAPSPAVAAVRLSAAGSFVDAVGLVSTLVEPGSGLVLQKLTLAPDRGGVALGLDAVAVGPPDAAAGSRP